MLLKKNINGKILSSIFQPLESISIYQSSDFQYPHLHCKLWFPVSIFQPFVFSNIYIYLNPLDTNILIKPSELSTYQSLIFSYSFISNFQHPYASSDFQTITHQPFDTHYLHIFPRPFQLLHICQLISTNWFLVRNLATTL